MMSNLKYKDRKYVNAGKKPVIVEIRGKMYSVYRKLMPGQYLYARVNSKINNKLIKRVR